MALVTFSVSLGFSAPVQGALSRIDIGAALASLGAVIAAAVLADILAVAVAAAPEAPLHAMASDRVPGAREAVWIARHAPRVNSFFADVVGDVCGTVSGAIGAAVSVRLSAVSPGLSLSVISIVVLGLIAALTVGSKAYTKTFALRHAVGVVLVAGRCVHAARVAAASIIDLARWLMRPFVARRALRRSPPAASGRSGPGFKDPST
ncbi:MAG TPA: hypothetical protein VF234_05130 [Limnochordia bacterium]